MIKGTMLSLSLQDIWSAFISFKIDTACPFLSSSAVSGQLSSLLLSERWWFQFRHAFCPAIPGVICVLRGEGKGTYQNITLWFSHVHTLCIAVVMAFYSCLITELKLPKLTIAVITQNPLQYFKLCYRWHFFLLGY